MEDIHCSSSAAAEHLSEFIGGPTYGRQDGRGRPHNWLWSSDVFDLDINDDVDTRGQRCMLSIAKSSICPYLINPIDAFIMAESQDQSPSSI